ncbi:phosphoglycerate kinase [Chloroflexota bacterium]
MSKMTVWDIEVSGKRALVRVDFNVPMDEATGAITDETRIRASLPTIKYLIDQGAKIILCSHLGRPEGKMVNKLRLAPIGKHLSQILDKTVTVLGESTGAAVEKAVERLERGDILLLENVRFYPEEEINDPSFAEELSRLADVYVNDAFGAAHRAHASTVGVARHLPAVAGLLLERELQALGGILANPAHPFAILIGGAKVSDKIGMIKNVLDKVDTILIGGGMAATFLKARSHKIGTSLVENDKLDLTARLMQDMKKRGIRFLLPEDVIVAESLGAEAEVRTVPVSGIPDEWQIVDIGPETIRSFSEQLQGCQTVFWNGPLGIYEIPQFAEGTQSIARLLAGLDATTIIGGGSTAEMVTHLKLADRMTFISTGGGASLHFLSGKTLPGVAVLWDKEES